MDHDELGYIKRPAEVGDKRFPNLMNDAVHEVPAFRLEMRTGK